MTEAHLGCTPNQQASWLAYAWNSALEARRGGADVRAITAWALLGAHGWDRLVTKEGGSYEAGAFSVQNGVLQSTPLADFIKRLASGDLTATERGWWTMPDRLLHAPTRSRTVRA